jgi:hypothetical protein
MGGLWKGDRIMLENIKKMTLGAALAAASIMAATPAEARDRYRDRGDDAAIAVGAGIIGLAIGAAIASDRGRDRYYRDRRYYRSYPNGYYYDSYPRYRGSYYRDNRREWRRSERRWDRRGYSDYGRRYGY